MCGSIPTIEIPDYTYALSMGSPHRKGYSAATLMSNRVCAELVVNSLVLTFGKKVQIDVT